MSYQFLSNIGSVDELRKAVSVAVAENDSHGTMYLLLDKARTVRIDRTQRLKDEMVVHAKDVEDDTSVILHLPYDNSAAQADIITYPKGEH